MKLRSLAWGLQAGTASTLVVLTSLTIIGAFMLSTYQWTPVRHKGNLVGRTISPEFDVNFEEQAISPDMQLTLDSMQADRDAEAEAKHAALTHVPQAPPEEEVAAAEEEAPAPPPPPDPIYKYHIHGFHNVLLLEQLAPLFMMGLTAILLRYFASLSDTAPGAYKVGHYIRYFLNQPIVPATIPFTRVRLPLHHYVNYLFNGCTIIEFLLYAWLLIVPWIWMGRDIKKAYEEWAAGDISIPPGIDNLTKSQHILNTVAIDFGVLYIIIGPLLFLPAARGSLVNSFLGVHYGTMIKWHRWVGVMSVTYLFLHGILYHSLWASDGAEVYRREAYMWKGKISNLAGLLSWVGMLVLVIPAIPWFRRRFYFIFYNLHVIGAVSFIAFGILHWSGNLNCSMLGLAVWAMDVAYRLYQTTYTVDVRLQESDGSRIISVVIPLEDGHKYSDGCHIWLCFPGVQRLRYHPFSVASCSGDPAWQNHLLVQSKVFDKWTKMVADRLAGSDGKGSQLLAARIQGPFDGHTWPRGKEAVYSKLIFASGGIGCTGILSHLQRAAMRRAAGDTGPPLALIHSCRDIAEIQVLAPLLAYAAHVDVRIHYTGSASISARTLEAPSPTAVNIYSNGGAAAAAEAGKGTSAQASDGLGLIHPFGSGLLHFTVLCLTVFGGFWLYHAHKFWYGSDIFAGQRLLADNTAAHRYARANALALFCFFLLVPVLPLLVITIWRTAARSLQHNTQAVSANGSVAHLSDSLDSGSDGKPSSHGKRSSSGGGKGREQPIDAATSALVLDGSTSDGNLTISSAAAPGITFPVATGRPDFPALLSDLMNGCTGTIGLWAAGPKAFNWAAAEAARESGHSVDVSQMAFEL